MKLRDFVLQDDGRGLEGMQYAGKSLSDLTPLSIVSNDVTVYFKNLRDELIKKICRYPIVVGCVAWLTSPDICRALATREHASFVIQKGDFLRPDAGEENEGVEGLRKKYQKLYGPIGTTNWERHMFGDLLSMMSYLSDPVLEGVRCVGVKKGYVKPLMHHKFAVFCDVDHETPCPIAVWTGSYNWTNNGENSFENAVFIEDGIVAAAYFHEWARLTAVSEPLDWNHKYVAPQWRVGS